MITANFDLDRNREFYIPHNSNEQGNNVLVQKITCMDTSNKKAFSIAMV